MLEPTGTNSHELSELSVHTSFQLCYLQGLIGTLKPATEGILQIFILGKLQTLKPRFLKEIQLLNIYQHTTGKEFQGKALLA